jgi:predicted ATPase
LPVRDLVRANCGIHEADTPASVVEKVRFGLQEVGLDADAHTPYMLHLLGIDTDGSLGNLSPEAIKARIFDTLRTWCLYGSQQRPIIVAIEDLHWIDQPSEEYLATLVESVAAAPILLLCTWRPGYRAAWSDHSYATQLALRRLNRADSLPILTSVLGPDRIPGRLTQLVLERAEGNPFFVEELAHAASEHGEIAAAAVVLDTIQGVLMARMDRLPETARQVLQTGAVLGREFPLQLHRVDGRCRLTAKRRRTERISAANRHPTNRSLEEFQQYWAERHGPLGPERSYSG